jgi:thiosulfate dehydrogenase (quinone) large subunit
VTTYGLRVPKDVIASTFTDHPKLPVLLSRAAFRGQSYVDRQEERRARTQRERRNFVRGLIGAAVFSLSALLLFEIGSFFSQPAQTATTVSYSATPTSASLSTPLGQSGRLLANASNIPTNQALNLSDPNLGPILLIHLDNGQFVAYSSICTHAGCQVQFDPSARDIACPCHGALFDPYHNAQVVRGPARSPLQTIPIQYNSSTGNIYIAG